jgi:hypothetical protein
MAVWIERAAVVAPRRTRMGVPGGILEVRQRDVQLEVLAKLRCCPYRATAIVRAILVLHNTETSPNPR